MDKNRNCSIDIFRYVCAILVVVIHTIPFGDISKEMGYIFSQIISRIAVPFFFSVSGYYYIGKLEKKTNYFIRYLKRILVTYTIWSCLYFMIDFIRWGHKEIIVFIKTCIINFFIRGSYYHFWFFVALIISVVLTTFLFKIKCKKVIIPLTVGLYILGCFGCSYYRIGVKIPIVKEIILFSEFEWIRRVLFMGFPFFISGYVIYKIKNKFLSKISNKKLIVMEGLIVLIWIAEICIVLRLKLKANLFITFALYPLIIITMLLLIKNPCSNLKDLGNQSKILANLTYYIHPFLL